MPKFPDFPADFSDMEALNLLKERGCILLYILLYLLNLYQIYIKILKKFLYYLNKPICK